MIEGPIVDSHVHLVNPAFRYSWMEAAPSLNRQVLPKHLAEAAAPVEIDRFVFLEVDIDPDQRLDEARWVAGLAEEEPRLQAIVPSAAVEKGAAIADDLDRLAALRKVRGIRRLIQDETDPEFCIRPGFLEGLSLLPARNLSFDICIYHHQMEAAIEMVRRSPDVSFVLDHIGKPGIRAGLFDPWREHMRTLAGFENVWCKISGVVTEADHERWTREEIRPYVEHALECFGFGRAMYGGDWHVVELAAPYAEWVDIVDWITSACSQAERQALFRDNAIRFYRLDE